MKSQEAGHQGINDHIFLDSLLKNAVCLACI